jgi:hypothetical protein
MSTGLALATRWGALTKKQKLVVGGGVAVGTLTLILIYWKRSAIMELTAKGFDYAKDKAFQLALPTNVGRWTTQILNSAQKYNVSPWALAAIMYNESRGGDALTPKGDSGGTGDFTPRTESSSYFKYANPATGLPPDGLGWGRGLMQVDYGVHIDWFKAGANWRDPQVNIDKAAEILAEKIRYFTATPSVKAVAVEAWRVLRGMPQYNIMPWSQKYPRTGTWPVNVKDVRPLSGDKLMEAAVASYNASYSGVLQAMGLGLPAEAATTRQEYVSKFLGLIATWQVKFK